MAAHTAPLSPPDPPPQTQPPNIPSRENAPTGMKLGVVCSEGAFRKAHLVLDTFSPVNQNGSFEFDRVIKSAQVLKRTKKTKVSFHPLHKLEILILIMHIIVLETGLPSPTSHNSQHLQRCRRYTAATPDRTSRPRSRSTTKRPQTQSQARLRPVLTGAKLPHRSGE